MDFQRSCISPKEESVSTIQWCSVNPRTNGFQQFYEQSQSNSGMDVWGSKNFKSTDFKKCSYLSNAHTCLYKNNVSQYFATDPPLLDEYFQ